ncbi:MAG: hypothetical protein O2894_11025 [Planctomycetota bacterium]|nr:hypothetical protein [Planctomycetota bacterium]
MRPGRPALEPSPLAPSRFSPPLAVTGLLMIGVILVMANPLFGVKSHEWPWKMLIQGHSSLLVDTVLLLWIGTGFWCVALAFTEAVTLRALGAAALGGILLLEVTAGPGGLTIATFNLNQMVPMIMLGGGLLLMRSPPSRSVGRPLVLMGVGYLVWVLATSFGSGGGSRLLEFFDEVAIVVRDPGHEFADRLNHFWWGIVPQALVLLAAAVAVVAALGVRPRLTASVGFWLLVAGLVSAGLAGTVLQLREGSGLRALLEQIVETGITRGTLLWMLGTFAIADIGARRGGVA